MTVTKSNVITVKTDPEKGGQLPHPIRDFIAQFLDRFKLLKLGWTDES